MFSTISYRASVTGGGVKDPALPPQNPLNGNQHVILLLHGYNNNEAQALASYNQFLSKLGGAVPAYVVGIYWPGDNWEGPVYYMQSMAHVRQVAALLARDIYNAAANTRYLQIDMVAHSLGNRLVLETMKRLQALMAQSATTGNAHAPALVIGNMAFMAGAVPISYLGDARPLYDAITGFGKTLSLYSHKDLVLHYGFLRGESLLEEGMLPIALGRRYWAGGQYAAAKGGTNKKTPVQATATTGEATQRKHSNCSKLPMPCARL